MIAYDEVSKQQEETITRSGETNETMGEFRRVKKILFDVRIELVSSHKALLSSEEQVKKKELEKQRSSVQSLRDAHIEAESERVKLKVSTAMNTSTRGVRVSSESKPRLFQLKEDLRKANELIASFSSEKN